MQISVKIPVSKACTLDRIGRKGSKSLVSPHVFGAQGSILGGASAGAEEASQSGMVLMSSPCAAALRCFVWDVAQLLSSKVEATSKPSCKIPKAG